MTDISHVLDLLEDVRNFLNEAPIQELEAVETALGRNAPIPQIAEAIDGVWKLTDGHVAQIEAEDTPSLNLVKNCTDTASGNGRSLWHWFLMPNGDVLLGTYPQGDLYQKIKQEVFDD